MSPLNDAFMHFTGQPHDICIFESLFILSLWNQIFSAVGCAVQVWIFIVCARAHQHVNMSHPNTFMHTLYVCSHYITPCVENDRLFRGYDSLPMLFVFRVTSCPPLTDPSPLTLVRQPADTSTELTAPKAHWPQMHREKDRERGETELWPSTSLEGGAVYMQLEWQFTCSKRSR